MVQEVPRPGVVGREFGDVLHHGQIDDTSDLVSVLTSKKKKNRK